MKSNTWRVLFLALFMAPEQLAIAQSTIRIRIENVYRVQLNLGFGSAKRTGGDTVEGTLTLQPDGTWTGKVRARVKRDQEMKGLGQNCPLATLRILQRLAVTARTVGGFNSTNMNITYTSGSASGGFLALEVKPDTEPSIPPGPCFYDMHGNDSQIPLLPLNDGRWTNPPPYGYVIGLPRSGVLEYVDVDRSCGSTASPPAQKPPVCSEWRIRVERH